MEKNLCGDMYTITLFFFFFKQFLETKTETVFFKFFKTFQQTVFTKFLEKSLGLLKYCTLLYIRK